KPTILCPGLTSARTDPSVDGARQPDKTGWKSNVQSQAQRAGGDRPQQGTNAVPMRAHYAGGGESIRAAGDATALTIQLATQFCQLASRSDLSRQHGKFGLDHGDILLVFGVAQGFFSALARLKSLGFVQVFGADGRVGQYGYATRLHLEDASGDEHADFFTAIG